MQPCHSTLSHNYSTLTHNYPFPTSPYPPREMMLHCSAPVTHVPSYPTQAPQRMASGRTQLRAYQFPSPTPSPYPPRVRMPLCPLPVTRLVSINHSPLLHESVPPTPLPPPPGPFTTPTRSDDAAMLSPSDTSAFISNPRASKDGRWQNTAEHSQQMYIVPKFR
jgi:hypothetical protein